ncbi:MAG: hypothetical protein JJT76_12960 [Clostridiaceae bacterium]|nr:hypothetical protein [Clostridiaceae bacterium]
MKKLTKEEFRERALRDISKKKEKESNEYLGYLTELRSKVKKRRRFAR